MRMFILFLSLVFSNVALSATLPICSIVGENARPTENLLLALTTTPTPAFFVMKKEGRASFTNPSKAYADVLETSERSIIINNLEELRFISQTLAHSDILLILEGKSEIDWTAEKSKKVLSVAKILDIKVSLLWLGEKGSPKALKDMVIQSGGSTFETKDVIRRVESLCHDSFARK